MKGVKQAILCARRSLMEFEEGRSMLCEQVRDTISHRDRRVLRHQGLRAHFRDCDACAAFAAAISARRVELRMLAPPLSPLLAASLRRNLLGTGAHHASGAGGLAALVPGKSVGATA